MERFSKLEDMYAKKQAPYSLSFMLIIFSVCLVKIGVESCSRIYVPVVEIGEILEMDGKWRKISFSENLRT